MTSTLTYLYAVSRGLPAETLDGAAGLDRLRLVEEEGLQAVVSDVPQADFDEDALKRNLEDLAWVERVARAHDEVVRLVSRHGTAVPLRLVTLFTNDDGVRAALATWRAQIEEAIGRVRGRHEWSVKGFLKAGEPSSTSGVDEGASGRADEPGAGAAYLARKRALVHDRRRAELEATELAEAVHTGLAGHAVATRLLPAQDPQLTGRSERMVLNGAYLVDDAEEHRFLDGLAVLRERYPAVELEVGGPWAPYSFATLEAPRTSS